MSDRKGIGSPQERELQYYRRECNDLGARLLRLQEEQSQAFLEARRSRMVVRLVREAYRLAEPTQATNDVGGALLQIVVENALCDRAALLREEPLDSGRFLIAHAIGGPSVNAREVIQIPNPPGFFFTNSVQLDSPPPGLQEVLHLPFMLWAYDRSSGYALAIGNRVESHVSRPFEAGDQELIETALSVYLDIVYRKYAEAQLRQARQAAEEASQTQALFLEALSHQLRRPIESIKALSQAMSPSGHLSAEPGHLRATAQRLAESSQELITLADDALRLAKPSEQLTELDVQWIDLGELMRQVYRSVYPNSVKEGVDLDLTLPKRGLSICVDRESMHRAIQTIARELVGRALPGSMVRLSVERRGDGAVEIIVNALVQAAHAYVGETTATEQIVRATHVLLGPGSNRVATARRIVEAHGCILVNEARPGAGSQARIIVPLDITRADTSGS